jgi:glycosyltransferase involved in cell wall biosynthesis
VPGIFFIGEDDLYYRNNLILGIYSVNRSLGANWTLITEKETKHSRKNSKALSISFFESIMSKRLRENKLIDIIEVTEGAFINQIAKKWKVIVRAHGSDWSFRMHCDDQNPLIDNYLKKWQRIQHLNASANYAISKHTRDHLTKELNLSKGVIRYMPYPICLENFSLAKPKSYKEIPSTSPIIMSVGRLERRKGTDIIVKSMNIVWEKYPNAYLILIGLASEFTIHDLKELVPKSQQNQIVYTGFINYKDIPSFYKAADLYVSASQYETFGYTLLEAMAAAKPIVCTDRGAMP